MGPFDRFNDRAKRVLALAQDEAIRLTHDYIGPEHLLLGLIREGEGTAGRVLSSLGIDLGDARRNVETNAPRGTEFHNEIQLHPRTKRIVELAVEEARARGSQRVGTEHLLLALIRVTGDDAMGTAAKAVASFGVTAEKIRQEVVARIDTSGGGDTPEKGRWTSYATGPTAGRMSAEEMAKFKDQQLTEVRRVIGAGQVRSIGDASLTLLSFEIYADGAVAQFLVAQRRPPDVAPNAFGIPDFAVTLTDDQGTQYGSRSYGGSGGGGRPGGMMHWRMAQSFAPALPDAARKLKLTVNSLTWRGHGSDPHDLVETSKVMGPWEWEIDAG